MSSTHDDERITVSSGNVFRDRRNTSGTISRTNLVIPVPAFTETNLGGRQTPVSAPQLASGARSRAGEQVAARKPTTVSVARRRSFLGPRRCAKGMQWLALRWQADHRA